MNALLVAASWLVQRDWRASVIRDLEEEASADGRGRAWLAWQLARIGVKTRWSFGGDSLRADAREVVRSLGRAKGFTTAAVLTCALGMGANVVVFSVFDRLMFRPLPYAEPDRLVQIHEVVLHGGSQDTAAMLATIAHALAADTTAFSGVSWADGWPETAVVPGTTTTIGVTPVYPNGLDVLGIHPVLGRSFVPSDVDGGTDPMKSTWCRSVRNGDKVIATECALLLTYETWRGRYASDPNVTSLTFKDASIGALTYHVIGVLPPGFVLPTTAFVEHVDGVYAMSDPRTNQKGILISAPFGRLAPGVTLARAQAEASRVVEDLAKTDPVVRDDVVVRKNRLTVQPIRSGLSMFVGGYLWSISAALWAVLAATCFNLSVLLLAWGRSRQRQAAVRAALGAPRSRLVRLALFESLAISTAGTVGVWIICAWARSAVLAVVPPRLRGFAAGPWDTRIMLISVGATILCALVAGLVPALHAGRVDLTAALEREAASTRATPRRGSNLLLAFEAAFGAVLVVGAAATVPAFFSLVFRSPGFEPKNLLLLDVNHRQARASTDQSRARVEMILNVIRAQPHVLDAAATFNIPVGVFSADPDFWDSHNLNGYTYPISGRYFSTMGTAMVAGRAFSDDEASSAAAVAVLNEAGARALWPGESVARDIGRTVKTHDGDRIVVGVAADIRKYPGATPIASLYIPIMSPEARLGQSGLPVLVRMAPGADLDRARLKTALDARFPPNGIRVDAVSEQLAPWLEQPRFLAVLMGALAAIALVLSAIGLYALASFEVTRRQGELGIRLSLGASSAELRRYIVRLTTIPAVVGAAIGLAVSWPAGALFAAHVTNVDVHHPGVYVGAAFLMIAVALVATWRPARRASRTNPVTVLRAL